MKKVIASLLAMVSLFFSGCMNSLMYMDEAQVISRQLDSVLEFLQAGDKESFISLFSLTAINSAGFSENVNALFDYYEGDNASYYDDQCAMSGKEREDSQVKEEIWNSYDVTTSEETYRIMIYLITRDDACPENIGIYSLYIIRMEDDTNPEYAYWGDGKDAPGIHIGIPSPED